MFTRHTKYVQFLFPRTDRKTFVGLVLLDFRENFSHKSEIEEYDTKKMFENRLRISCSKTDFPKLR